MTSKGCTNALLVISMAVAYPDQRVSPGLTPDRCLSILTRTRSAKTV